MMKTITTYHVFIILGVLSAAAGTKNFLSNDMTYGNFGPDDLFKEKCLEFPDMLPCHYWNSLQEEADEAEENQNVKEITTNALPAENEEQEDNRKKDILLEIPLITPDRHLDKRFTVFRRRNPGLQGYKRGPGFRSWGGKRDYNLEKRSKFTSWGGKKSDPNFEDYFSTSKGNPDDIANDVFENNDIPGKRSKFRSWGGKRDMENPISYDQNQKRTPGWSFRTLYQPFKGHVPKRPHFQSWGGKRMVIPWDDFYFHRYPLFKSRALNGDKKRKFSSWGGKRNEDDKLSSGMAKRDENNFNGWDEKREPHYKFKQIFQNWGGKRNPADAGGQVEPELDDIFGVKSDQEELTPEIEENAKSETRKKRDDFNKNSESSPKFDFNSWGGKRGEEGTRR